MPRTRGPVPAAIRSRYEEIVALSSLAGARYLDAECAELAAELVAALARKRPSPLMQGRAAGWAAGALFAVARANFLFEPGQVPHCPPSALAAACGVSDSTAAAKARAIEAALDIGPLDPRWTLPSRLRDNLAVWLIEVDGFVVDARTLPRDLQEQALELGLIPFLP